MKTKRPMTTSPVALARAALDAARGALPAYSSRYSRKDYTQHQLFALLTLREFPGPANRPFVYGHMWVALGLLACHPARGVIALPLLARPYVRRQDLGSIDPWHRPPLGTKLELAVEPGRWGVTWLRCLGKP